MNLKISEIYNLFACCHKSDIDDRFIEGVSIDSREIKKGEIFFAIKGDNFDGHQYIEKALSNGACVVISEKKFNDKRVIVVKDTITAIGILAKYYRRKFNLPLISITGSVGKTSTKEILVSVLQTTLNVHSSIGNFNNHIGLPRTLFHLSKEHDLSVVEMGMNNFNEIDYLSNIASPTVGIYTNIGDSHIGNLGSKKNIFKAKLEMLIHLEKGGDLLVNGDDEYLKTLKDHKDFSVITFGFNDDNDVIAYDYELLSNEQCAFKVNKETYLLNVTGVHNVLNALPAIIIGIKFNIPITDIKTGLVQFRNEKMRAQVYQKGQYTVINDAYNASSLSMKAAIDKLMTYTNRKVAILGDMLEMGEFAIKNHYDIGQYVGESKVDVLFAIGNFSNEYIKGALKGGLSSKQIYQFKQLSDAKLAINDILSDNDVLLIKGSRGSKMEIILEYINFKE